MWPKVIQSEEKSRKEEPFTLVDALNFALTKGTFLSAEGCTTLDLSQKPLRKLPKFTILSEPERGRIRLIVTISLWM